MFVEGSDRFRWGCRWWFEDVEEVELVGGRSLYERRIGKLKEF